VELEKPTRQMSTALQRELTMVGVPRIEKTLAMWKSEWDLTIWMEHNTKKPA
jgi:hypothetical protein